MDCKRESGFKGDFGQGQSSPRLCFNGAKPLFEGINKKSNHLEIILWEHKENKPTEVHSCDVLEKKPRNTASWLFIFPLICLG